MTAKNPDNTYNNYAFGGPVRVTAPGAGSTIALKSTERDLYVNNAGTYATLTVKMPPKPQPGEIVDMGFQSTVTALTVRDSAGAAISGSPTAAAANVALLMRYINATIGWVYWK